MSRVHSQGIELRFLKTWEAPGLRRKVGSRSSYLANWSGVQASASLVGGGGGVRPMAQVHSLTGCAWNEARETAPQRP